jgi:hypothetical protein
MRSTMKLSLASLAFAAGVSACGDAKATELSSELARDLEMASSTVALAAPKVDSALLGNMETQPKATQEEAPVVKKGAGPRAIRSKTPTVRATPETEVATAEEVQEEVEVMDIAPAPEETSEPVAVAPRPQPVVVATGGSGDYGAGNGGVYGGGVGVVIRGGGVDGDNCELHRRGGTRARGPIFVPMNIPRSGGSGTVVNMPPSRGTGTSIGSRTIGSRSGGSPRGAVGSASTARDRATARGVLSRGR